MRKYLLIIGVILMGLSSCNKNGDAFLSRTFPTASWERFDFIKADIVIKKPVTYNLILDVTFDPTYPYDCISLVFSIFDSNENPFRTKGYRFYVKEKDGSWKSTLTDGLYHFTFPINSELSINEPGTYNFQFESRMPITPVIGIHSIKVINVK